MQEQHQTHLKTKLISILGAGGVGKTTSSASLALALAHEGLKTVVITVDPARRLAGALGLDSLSSDPQRVYNGPNGGFTDALWISKSHGLSELVQRKLSKNPGFAEVKNNRLFKIIESQLGGIEEYLGIERILSLAQSGEYDVCVLDTPPSRHALDFFESPRHILKFFDEGVLKHFIKEDDRGFKKGNFFTKMIQKKGFQAFEIFRNFLGSSFVDELSSLLSQLKPVRDLLSETATSIETWIRSENSHLILCSTLEDYSLREIEFLTHELRSKNLPKSDLLIFNKCINTKLMNQGALKELSTIKSLEASILSSKIKSQLNKLEHRSAALNMAAKTEALVPRIFFETESLNSLLELGRNTLNQWPNNPAKKALKIS